MTSFMKILRVQTVNVLYNTNTKYYNEKEAIDLKKTFDTRLQLRNREGMSDDRKVFGWTRRLSKKETRFLYFSFPSIYI